MTVAWTAAQLARAANQAEAVRWVAVTQVAVTTGRVAVTAGSKAAAGTLVERLGRPTAGSGVAAGAAAAAAAGAVAPTAAAAAVRAAPFLRRGTIQLEPHSTRQEARERAMPKVGLRTTAYRSPLACPRSAAGRRASRRPYLLHRPSQSSASRWQPAPCPTQQLPRWSRFLQLRPLASSSPRRDAPWRPGVCRQTHLHSWPSPPQWPSQAPKY